MTENQIKALWMAQYLGQQIINKPYTGFPPSEKDFFTEEGELMYVYCDRQRYWCFSVLNNDSLGNPRDEFSNQPIQDGTLCLRTVDMLTDEEAIAIGEIINVSPYKYVDTLGITDAHPRAHVIQFYDKNEDPYGGTVHIYLDGAIIWHYENIGKYDHHCLRLLEAYSYLRSIGILLPFTYLNSDNQPATLQPSYILAKGWAKIKVK